VKPWRLTDTEWEHLRETLEGVRREKPARGRPGAGVKAIAQACLYRFFHARSDTYKTVGWLQMPGEINVAGSTANRRFLAWKESGAWLRFWDGLMELRHGKARAARRTKRRGPRSPVAEIIVELERAYDFFNQRFFGGTLPHDVVITVERGSRRNCPGYFCSRLWRDGEKELGQIAICTSALGSGAERALAVLLHELVHLRNDHVGLPDCDATTQYHKQHFQEVALVAGLECAPRDRTYGFAHTRLAERGRETIAMLRPRQDAFRWKVGGGN